MDEFEHGGLTRGPILQVLAKLALPIMASSFLSTAYSITDMAWIGLLGSKAVAGVGVGGMYVWLSQGFSTLARMGGQVRMGQAIGRGDRQAARNYAAGALQMVTVFGLLFGAVCLLFTDTLVGFFALDDALTIQYAKIYLRVTCGLIIFQYIILVLTGLYTAQGDSKIPLKANFIGLVCNMILDPVLILGLGPVPRLEVLGAAIATVTAQFVSFSVLVYGIVKAKHHSNILQEIHVGKLQEKHIYTGIAGIGIPAALQVSLYCGISMVLTRMVAGFGEAAIAVQRVGGQIESLSWNTAEGFAAAMNAFSAQNFGAGDICRVRKGYKISFWTMTIWGLAITAIFVFFPLQISHLFFHEAEVIPVSINYLIIVGLSEAFMCVEIMAGGAISGLGNTKLVSIISIFFTSMRIPLAIILSKTALGLDGIWWALTITSVLKGIILHFAFYRQCGRCESDLCDWNCKA